MNVVANDVDKNGVQWPISYDPASNTCVLKCHNAWHDPGGGIR